MQFWNVNISHNASDKMSASMKNLAAVFRFLCVLMFLSVINFTIDASSHEFHDFFLCKKCGREIIELADVVNMPTPRALKTRNQTIGHTPEILIQTFRNPHGETFDVVTASKADVLKASHEMYSDTWWLGFSWFILVCPQCRQHIGWEYIPSDKKDTAKKTFFGIVFGNLLYENDADNLIVVPKSYTS